MNESMSLVTHNSSILIHCKVKASEIDDEDEQDLMDVQLGKLPLDPWLVSELEKNIKLNVIYLMT